MPRKYKDPNRAFDKVETLYELDTYTEDVPEGGTFELEAFFVDGPLYTKSRSNPTNKNAIQMLSTVIKKIESDIQLEVLRQ